MPSIVKNKGMAKMPSFYSSGDSASTSTPNKGRNLPILIGVVAIGAAIVLYMRARDLSPSNVGPALTVVPTTDADQSNIANMIQALKAIGRQPNTPTNPGGGTSTPITPSNPINPPNTTTPPNPSSRLYPGDVGFTKIQGVGFTSPSQVTGVLPVVADRLANVDRNWLLSQKPARMNDVQFINLVGFYSNPLPYKQRVTRLNPTMPNFDTILQNAITTVQRQSSTGVLNATP